MGIAVFPSGMKGGSLGKSREELIYRVSAFMIEELKLNRFKAVVQVKQTRTRKLMNHWAAGYASMDVVDTDNGMIKWGLIELCRADKQQFIKTLIHEWVHIKQYLRKELSMDGTKWKKSDISDVPYEDQPCEKEAYMLQEIYYKKWLTSDYV